tara:strand:+ start:61 stop:468 length:408 start_codon:yes stop_codon:yes gene_type:complete
MSQGKEKGLMIGGVHAPILEKMLPGILRQQWYGHPKLSASIPEAAAGGGMSQRRSTQGLMIGGMHAPILEKMLPGILRQQWYGHPKLDVEKPRNTRGLAIEGVPQPMISKSVINEWLELIKDSSSQAKKPIDLFE